MAAGDPAGPYFDRNHSSHRTRRHGVKWLPMLLLASTITAVVGYLVASANPALSPTSAISPARSGWGPQRAADLSRSPRRNLVTTTTGLVTITTGLATTTTTARRLPPPTTVALTIPPRTSPSASSTTIAAPISAEPPPNPTGGSGLCGPAIAAVEARGLFPAPGFEVICGGDAQGHEGMTCVDEPGICPGQSEIVIAYISAYVVANEFENSRIFSGLPTRCNTIDCGSAAYGF